MSGSLVHLAFLSPAALNLAYFSVLRSRKLKMRYSELSLCERILTLTRFGGCCSSSTVNRSLDLWKLLKGSPLGDRCWFCVKFSLPSISKMVSIFSRQRTGTGGWSMESTDGSSSKGSNGSNGSRSSSGMSSAGSSCGLGKLNAT